MKLFAIPALALCLLMLVACGESTAPKPEAADIITNANNKVEADVEGMDCTGCSGSIVAAVEQIEGVTAATADVATGHVVVALADDADAQTAKAEIEKVIAGLSDGKYTVKTISATTGGAATTGDEPDAEPAEQPAAEEEARTETNEEAFVFTSYKVTGMDCSGCSSHIVKAVEQVDGVLKVKADHATGAVEVSFADRFDDKVKTDEIKDVIAGLSDGKYTVSY